MGRVRRGARRPRPLRSQAAAIAQAPGGSPCWGIKVLPLSAAFPGLHPALCELAVQVVLAQGCGRDPQPCPLRSLGGPCCSGLLGQHGGAATLNGAQRCAGTASLRCPAVTVLPTRSFNFPRGTSREPQIRTAHALSNKKAFIGRGAKFRALLHISDSLCCSLPCL